MGKSFETLKCPLSCMPRYNSCEPWSRRCVDHSLVSGVCA